MPDFGSGLGDGEAQTAVEVGQSGQNDGQKLHSHRLVLKLVTKHVPIIVDISSLGRYRHSLQIHFNSEQDASLRSCGIRKEGYLMIFRSLTTIII